MHHIQSNTINSHHKKKCHVRTPAASLNGGGLPTAIHCVSHTDCGWVPHTTPLQKTKLISLLSLLELQTLNLFKQCNTEPPLYSKVVLYFYCNLGKDFDWLVPQPVKQKTRTHSERKWCVGLSSSVVSLSPGSLLNTHLSRTIQAAQLRVGGSGLQTMSNIWKQSFCTITTRTRVAKMGGITQIEHLYVNVATSQSKTFIFTEDLCGTIFILYHFHFLY